MWLGCYVVRVNDPEPDVVFFAKNLEPVQISGVGFFFEDEQDPRLLPGLGGVVEGLPYCLGPFGCEVDFDGIVVGQAINPGAIEQGILSDATDLVAPLLLVDFFCVQVLGRCRCAYEQEE
jgi:hypothetical protein